jgi:hypothetical protein
LLAFSGDCENGGYKKDCGWHPGQESTSRRDTLLQANAF